MASGNKSTECLMSGKTNSVNQIKRRIRIWLYIIHASKIVGITGFLFSVIGFSYSMTLMIATVLQTQPDRIAGWMMILGVIMLSISSVIKIFMLQWYKAQNWWNR